VIAARRLAWLALALAAAWRVLRWSLGFPLFGDEAFLAASFTSGSTQALHGTLEYEMVAPLGFLYSVWLSTRALGLGELGLRFAPVVASLAALPLLARLCRVHLGRHEALLAIALFAASYYPLRHATELKPYSFDLYFSCALLISGAALLRTQCTRTWIVFAVTSAIAVWCSYPAAFVAGGVVLTLAWTHVRAERSARQGALLAGAALLLVASFLGMYVSAGQSQQWSAETIEGGQWAAAFPPDDWSAWPAWLWRQHTGRMFAYPNGGRSPGSLATTLLVIAGAVTLVRSRRGAFAGMLLASLPLMLIAAALGKYPYGSTARTCQHLAVPICMLAGVGLAGILTRLPRRLGPRVARGLALLLIASVIFGAASDLREPFKHPSDQVCREACEWLGEVSAEEDTWVVFGALRDEPGIPDLTTWGGSTARLRYYLEREAPAGILWGQQPGPDGAVWVVAYRDNAAPFPADDWEAFRGDLHPSLQPARARTFTLSPSNGESLTFLEFRPE
jgi:hypothetical protein